MLLILLSIFVLAYAQTRDWFSQNSPPCPNDNQPRVRRAFGDMSYDDRKTYVRLIYQMRLHKEAFIVGSTTKISLYDAFQQIHASSYNGMLHGTSAFLPQHKILLWMYESAWRWIGFVDGPTMSPPITSDWVCRNAQPYWEWDLGYVEGATASTSGWFNIGSTDLFEYPDLFGDSTPIPGSYEIDQGYFAASTAFNSPDIICGPNGQYCNYELKRRFDSSWLSTPPANIRNYIVNFPTFTGFLPYIHGGLHGMIHNYIGFSMANTGTAGLDPCFYMHHTNIDRFYAIWADCNGYENIIVPTATQYSPVNPISSGSVRTDPKGIKYAVKANEDMWFATTTNRTCTFFPRSQWPTPNEAWPMGTAAARGVLGIFYRYGPDKMAVQLTDRCPDKVWSWVNYGA